MPSRAFDERWAALDPLFFYSRNRYLHEYVLEIRSYN